jgi:hypothetical protein
MRWPAALALALLVVLAGCAQVTAPDTTETPATDQPTDAATPQATQTPAAGTPTEGPTHPPDPDSDGLGWENGYWYNETVVVDASDGLNDSELEKVVARAMARVESVRRLEFEETVPVTVLTREEFRAEQDNRTLPERRKLFDNVKFEALFMINESTDSIGIQNDNSGAAVGGYYSPEQNEIVVVSENVDSPQLDELTLAHELTHALQDQRYNLSSFDQSTRERHNAIDGIVEGDANYVQHLYEQRCADEWEGECLADQPGGESGSDGGLANYGTYILKFHPYSDGPPFVKSIRDVQGWEGVNAVYENPPASTEQIIYPEMYPDERPRELAVDDRTGDGWERLRMDERPEYAELGEAGLFSMFMYPAYETGGTVQIVPAQDFFNTDANGDLDDIDPLNYDHAYTDGWDGDRMAVYTNDGATGYVWKLAWDSEADAAEFLEGYRKLLSYRNASEVEGHENTWLIDEVDDYSGAYYLQQDGDTVVIVRAPSVDELPAVREGAAPAS